MVRVSGLRQRVGERVRARRTELALTQEALAERLDLDESTVRAIESGRRGVSLETLVALADCLEVEPGTLVDDVVAPATHEIDAARLVKSLDPRWQASALRLLRELVSLQARRT